MVVQEKKMAPIGKVVRGYYIVNNNRETGVAQSLAMPVSV